MVPNWILAIHPLNLACIGWLHIKTQTAVGEIRSAARVISALPCWFGRHWEPLPIQTKFCAKRLSGRKTGSADWLAGSNLSVWQLAFSNVMEPIGLSRRRYSRIAPSQAGLAPRK